MTGEREYIVYHGIVYSIFLKGDQQYARFCAQNTRVYARLYLLILNLGSEVPVFVHHASVFVHFSARFCPNAAAAYLFYL